MYVYKKYSLLYSVINSIATAIPLFTESPKSVVVLPDKPFKLNCNFTLNAKFELLWVINDFAHRVNELPKEKYQASVEERYSVLTVFQAGTNKTTYQCVLLDRLAGIQIRSEEAVVFIVGKFRKSLFLINLQYTYVVCSEAGIVGSVQLIESAEANYCRVELWVHYISTLFIVSVCM